MKLRSPAELCVPLAGSIVRPIPWKYASTFLVGQARRRWLALMHGAGNPGRFTIWPVAWRRVTPASWAMSAVVMVGFIALLP